jgi:hypothetical protein
MKLTLRLLVRKRIFLNILLHTFESIIFVHYNILIQDQMAKATSRINYTIDLQSKKVATAVYVDDLGKKVTSQAIIL